MQKRRRNVERSAQTRAQLIEGAIAALCERGYARSTTALIAARAGVTTGALHHHFPTKEDLLVAVLDRLSADVSAQAGDVFAFSGRVGGDTERAVRRLWTVYGAPRYRAAWEIIIGTNKDPAMRARMTRQREESMNGLIARWFADRQLGRREQELVAAALQSMLIAIRGLFLETYLDFPAAYYERQLALLSRTVAAQLEEVLGPRWRTPRPRARAA
ncbi:MAG: TetR/AcrR family transcriptional regulator [Alphaproteobacteria bacterium]|nr:TetR/AcrR family transcriptional regulator [Alphaproteobacteria bacterium]